MKMQAYKFDMIHFKCAVNHTIHILHADSEFVFSQSGSDICMCMCTYIRIDTESNACYFIFGSSQLVDDFQFGNRFYVKTENIIIQP